MPHLPAQSTFDSCESPVPPAQNRSSLCRDSPGAQRGSCGSPLFILSPNECSSCKEPVTQVEIPNKFSPAVLGQLAISRECRNPMWPWHRGAVADFHHPESWTEFHTNPLTSTYLFLSPKVTCKQNLHSLKPAAFQPADMKPCLCPDSP